MKRSTDRILTTHAGSLVRPPEIIEFSRRIDTHEPYDKQAFEAGLTTAVAAVVRKQADVGIDVVDDGEFGKHAWIGYVTERLAGLDVRPSEGQFAGRAPGTVPQSARDQFAGFYAIYLSFEYNLWLPRTSEGKAPPLATPMTWVVTGPVSYVGQAAIQRDIANLKAALQGVDVAEAFLPTVAPCSVQVRPNEFYKSEEEYLYAIADALHEEYQAVVDAGFVLQVDDAILPMRYVPDGDFEAYRRWAEMQVAGLNHALRGIPADRVRYHICWGSQNVPHTWDVPLHRIVDIVLKVNAGAYSIEAANPRHEHEWNVWEDAKLPDGKIVIPGMISHSTNLVEHPELISQRLQTFARLVGRENVIAGTDCGFSQNWNSIRVHEEVQWAKLEALAEGARLASRKLWS